MTERTARGKDAVIDLMCVLFFFRHRHLTFGDVGFILY